MSKLTPQQVKDKLIKELDMGSLPSEEQDRIIANLAGALLERATVAVMSHVPESELGAMEDLMREGREEELRDRIMSIVPDAPQLFDKAIEEGIQEYKSLVKSELSNADGSAEREGSVSDAESLQKSGLDVLNENGEEMLADSAPIHEDFVVDESGEAQPIDSVKLEQTQITSGADFAQKDLNEPAPSVKGTIATDAGNLPSADDLQMPDTSIPSPLIDPKPDTPEQPAY